MKKSWLIIVPIAFLLFLMNRSGNSDASYKKGIHQYWEERNQFFQTSKASPFVQKGKTCNGIIYFDPNPDFRVNGVVKKYSKRETVRLGNSDGTSTTYLKYAIVAFRIKGEACSLLILKALGFGNQYLLAFADATSGETTYGGGRYLDVNIGKSNQVTLDFNKAYNPYCAYFNDFSCPLPPQENLLEVAIEAGEMDYTY